MGTRAHPPGFVSWFCFCDPLRPFFSNSLPLLVRIAIFSAYVTDDHPLFIERASCVLKRCLIVNFSIFRALLVRGRLVPHGKHVPRLAGRRVDIVVCCSIVLEASLLM